MPSTLTHSLFSMQVFDQLDEKIKNKLKNYKEYIKVFANGPDPLNFYFLDFPILGTKVRKKYPKLLHSKYTKKKFVSIIKYIKRYKLYDDSMVISYLYGITAHYFLDTILHPYIIYYSGNYERKDKSTYRYNGKHAKMEVSIDLYMIDKYITHDVNKFKLYNYCFNISKFNDNLKKVLDNCYKDVYGIDNFSKIYYKSIKDMRRINKLYRYDRYGIKKRIYTIFDKIIPKSIPKISPLSYHQTINLNYLNLNNNVWNHITNINEKYNYSFDELYNIALKKCVDALKIINDVLYNDESLEKLNRIFLNLSYITGKNCNNKNKIQYFMNKY